MRFYTTEYRLKDQVDPEKRTTFTSFIYAPSYSVACKIAVMRNIGEFVTGVLNSSDFDPCPLPSALYKKRLMKDCHHTLVFYTWIGGSAGVINPLDLLNDLGVLHEVVHEMHHPTFYDFRPEIFERLVALEKLIPGLTSYTIEPNLMEVNSK